MGIGVSDVSPNAGEAGASCTDGSVLGRRNHLRADDSGVLVYRQRGAWSSWTTGVSLLLVMLSSGGIAWSEFKSNPEADAERGEWTNKMLFYALVFAITFLVAFLYLPASTSPNRAYGVA